MAITYSFKHVLTILLACFMVSVVMARPLSPKSSLMIRLKLKEDESTKCWDSLFELQSCTGEVIMFFLNGETYLGPGCCSAIQTIEHKCWPAMLGSLGFTSEEGNILRGYCDATDSDSTPPAPPHTVNPTLSVSYDFMP